MRRSGAALLLAALLAHPGLIQAQDQPQDTQKKEDPEHQQQEPRNEETPDTFTPTEEIEADTVVDMPANI